MRTLEFNVSGQKLSKKSIRSFRGIVRGTRQYLRAEFSFDSEWAAMVAAAEFRMKDSSGVYPVLITNGSCMVPDAVADADTWWIRLAGKKGDTFTRTNEVKVTQEG